MNNKELGILAAAGLFISAATTGTIYWFKTKDKKKKNKRRLKEDMEILGASLENKGWWLSKECQTRSQEIIKWVEKEAKEEEIKNALKVIKEKHWMTKDYQTAFKTIYDWAKQKIQ